MELLPPSSGLKSKTCKNSAEEGASLFSLVVSAVYEIMIWKSIFITIMRISSPTLIVLFAHSSRLFT
jgi:hypothetical protein